MLTDANERDTLKVVNERIKRVKFNMLTMFISRECSQCLVSVSVR